MEVGGSTTSTDNLGPENGIAGTNVTRVTGEYATGLGLRRLVLVPVAAAMLGAALLSSGAEWRIGLAIGGLGVLLSVAALAYAARRDRNGRHAEADRTLAMVATDPAAVCLTDEDRIILGANPAAGRTFGPVGGRGLGTVMADRFASPGAVLRRLQARAVLDGAAQEDVTIGNGRARLSVHRLPEGQLLWRYDEFAGAAAGLSGEQAPLITVGRSNSILYMNDAARELVGGRPRAFEAIFDVLPLRPGEKHRVQGATGPVACVVIELADSGGRRELMLVPAEDDGAAPRPPDGPDYFDDLPVPLLLVSADGHIEMANPPARDLLGPGGVPGAMLSDVMEGLGRSLTDWLAEAASGRVPGHSEFLRLSHPEREAYVQVTLKRMARGGRSRLLAVLSDATELKTLEAQFVQSQKMQAIGQLAGGVAHDFNNLLTAISGHCDLLLLRHDPGDPDFGDLTQINQNANRAASLVGQLLAFSRKQTLRPEVLDLRDTLSDLTHLLNRLVGEKVTLSLSHDPLLRTIRADKRQLEQVLLNLVVNARDAMPDGGEIRIVTESLRLGRPMQRDRAKVAAGEYVSVRVIDTGRGIPADKLTKVFEPFFTTKRIGEGTGLGLSTAYGIVKQTGGFIFVDSEPGQGACFTLLFPVHDPAAQPEGEDPEVPDERVAPRMEARMAEGVVLLVEDEAPVRAFASQALRLRGYTVIEAENAEEALQRLQDNALHVDIFVTDVVMPGMDGPSWVRRALQDRPGVRVVFVSGYAEDSFGDTQSQIPNSVFLPKPFSLVQLTETVQRQLH